MKIYQRDKTFLAWRVAAIYRCVLRRNMSQEWALAKIRESFPDGSRDDLVDRWFLDMDRLRVSSDAAAPQTTEALDLFDCAA